MDAMDALTEFTAMSPPREGGEDSGRLQSLDESFSSSQCSADPSAFAGFQAAPSASLARFRASGAPLGGGDKRMRLTLDLKAAGAASTRSAEDSQAFGGGHLSELFSADTQDDEGYDARLLPDRKSPSARVAPAAGHKMPRRPTPPSLLSSVESARRQQKQPVVLDSAELLADGLTTDESRSSPSPSAEVAGSRRDAMSSGKDRRSSVPGSSKYSEDLMQFERNAARIPARTDRKPAAGHDSDSSAGLDSEHFAAKVVIQSRSAAVDATDACSDTGTEPYVPSDDERVDDTFEEETEQFPAVEGDEPEGPPVKSGASSLAGRDVASNADAARQVQNSPPWMADSESQEPDSHGYSDEEEEDDDYPPTQPSKAFYSDSMSTPVEEEPPIVVPPKFALKKREKIPAADQPSMTESQEQSYNFEGSQCRCGSSACRCEPVQAAGVKPSTTIRNLEFSFAMPESQDTESSQRNESAPDVHQVAAQALEAFGQGSQGNSSEDVSRRDKEVGSKKTAGSVVNMSLQPTPKKAKKAQTAAGLNDSSSPSRADSQQSVEATPTPARKRKRANTPSGPTQDDGASNVSQTAVSELTPSRPSRRSAKRLASNSSTPSSSQKARTRPKELSPLPTTRAYVSRSRTIFKFKFVFVVTGFSNKGETSMAELIHEHGGKVAEREQDVLYRGNTKAVVIATPVAWRKLKFMQAIACGIPVVHPEWIHRCIKASSVLPFDGYTVPSGYSISTRKFECLPVQQLSVFSGYRFGIATDVSDPSAQPKEMAHLVANSLKACGAYEVHENLTMAKDTEVDIVLCNEFTETCNYYSERQNVSVKNFSWVTECVILQKFIEPNECDFDPQREEQDPVLWASAVIGDLENSSLKLHVGELILADLSRNQIDHFLLFHVCEIIDIFVVRGESQAGGGSTRKRRADDAHKVVLRVGVLKRSPYSAGLSRRHARVLEIPSTQVKRRVVAVAKTDFDTFAYRDESVFFFEDDAEGSSQEKGKETSS